MRQLRHRDLGDGCHPINGSPEECMELAASRYLEQVPPISSNPDEPASVGMQDMVNAEDSFEQARSLPPPQHPKDPLSINDKSA
jgi:hypothetical protein